MKIDIRSVSKRFKNFAALNEVNLDIKSGELVALLGPSGSGKTTLLRIIAGLEWPDEGQVIFDGEDALTRRVGERRVGFVFQHYALFRHLTAFENIAFGLRVKPRGQRLHEPQIRRRVEELLEIVQLGGLGARFPSQLSGGQRQRVALARALAIEPRVLLLDEPFGALDARVRKELRRWLRGLHEEIHVTSVFVTHDQEEALEVADRVVVMDRGRIEQVGTPEEIYENPATEFVHEFIGESIVLPVSVSEGLLHFDAEPTALRAHGVRNGHARLFVRPSEMSIVTRGEGHFHGLVRRIQGFGSTRRIEVLLPGQSAPIEVGAPPDCRIDAGQEIGLTPRKFQVFPSAA